jgi:hypothetical protein
MAGIGFGSLINQDNFWTLASLDDDVVVRGQYKAEGIVKNTGARYTSNQTVGRAQPIRQFDSEDEDQISFTARCWAAHEGLPGFLGSLSRGVDALLGRTDSIEDIVEQIESLHRVVPSLGRPRIWQFSVGSSRSLEMVCTVDSVGGISYADLRGLNGDLRGVTFTISLTRFEEYDVGLNGKQNLSLIVPVLENDSFESLSKRVYGNASSGEPLRRRNPSKSTPSVGDLIHMPPQAALTLGYTMEPLSPVLKRTALEVARRKGHERVRSQSRRSFVLGPEWDGV